MSLRIGFLLVALVLLAPASLPAAAFEDNDLHAIVPVACGEEHAAVALAMEPEPAEALAYSSSRATAERELAALEAYEPLPPVAENAAPKPRFHWTPALLQAGEYLLIQHVTIFGMLHNRYGFSFGEFWPSPFWQNYVESVQGLRGWDDGDPFIDNYIGHPMQGAITGYIQIHNDDRGKRQRFGKSGDYWRSRMKAVAFATAYSTFFELGPLGEAGIENLGRDLKTRPCRNGTAMCPYSELAWVDLVITPTGGLGWLVMEDALDRYVLEKLDRKNGFVRGLARIVLNPSRTFANLLRIKAPWYRDRDEAQRMALASSASAGR